MDDPETEEALAEFDFLVTESGEGAGEARSHDSSDWGKPHCHAAQTPSSLFATAAYPLFSLLLWDSPVEGRGSFPFA